MKTKLFYCFFLIGIYSQAQKLNDFTQHGELIDFIHYDKDDNLLICGGEKKKLTKIAPDKSIVWSKEITGYSRVEQKTVVTTDSEGNVYWAGNFHMLIDVSFSDSEEEIVTPNSSFHHRGFLIKFSAEGDRLWYKIFEPTEEESGFHLSINSLVVDESDNLFLTGNSASSVAFNNLLSSQDFNKGVFVTKIDKNGNEVWTNTINTTANRHYYLDTSSHSMEYRNGNVVLTSSFWNDGFYEQDGEVVNFLSKGDTDVLIANLDSESGEIRWLKTLGGNDEDNGLGVAIDSNNNIFIQGYFNGKVDFDVSDNNYLIESPYWSSQFILKLDENGEFLWARAVIADERMGGYSSYSNSDISVTDDGRVFLFGKLVGGNLEVQSETNNLVLHENPFSSIFSIEFYNENGDVRNSKLFDRSVVYLTGVENKNSDIILYGSVTNSLDFDFSSDVKKVEGDLYKNGYVAEYNFNYSYIRERACDLYYFGNKTLTESGEYSRVYLDDLGFNHTEVLDLIIHKTSDKTERTVFITPNANHYIYKSNDSSFQVSEEKSLEYVYTSSIKCDSIVKTHFKLYENANGGSDLDNAKYLYLNGFYNIEHQNGSDAFYRFKAESNGMLKLSSVNLTDEDTLLLVFNSEGQTIGMSDDDGGRVNGLQSEFEVNLYEGDEIIFVWSSRYFDELDLDHYEFELSFSGESSLSTFNKKLAPIGSPIKYYNLLGKEVDRHHKGIIIEVYGNGAIRKRFN